MKMEQTVCSETSVYKIQTPENYQEESIQQMLHISFWFIHLMRRIFGAKKDEVTGEWRKPFGAGIVFFNFKTPCT